MFQKKKWKRGDKLTVKELNRMEEGIAASGTETIVTVDEDITNIQTTGPVFSNWSIDSTAFQTLVANQQNFYIKCNIHQNNEDIGQKAIFYSTFFGEKTIDFIGYVNAMGGILVATLSVNENTEELQFDYDTIN